MELTGNKYLETKNLVGTDIAKLMRKDIREAIKAKKLSKGKYSVVTRSSGYSIAIDIYVIRIDTGEEEKAYKVLRDIHSSYNFDSSDPMTDYSNVNFYGSVQ